MTDNIPAVIAFSFAFSGPMLVWSANRPRPDSWSGNAGLFVEVSAVVVVAAVLTRYAAIPALQWLAVRVP